MFHIKNFRGVTNYRIKEVVNTKRLFKTPQSKPYGTLALLGLLFFHFNVISCAFLTHQNEASEYFGVKCPFFNFVVRFSVM